MSRHERRRGDKSRRRRPARQALSSTGAGSSADALARELEDYAAKIKSPVMGEWTWAPIRDNFVSLFEGRVMSLVNRPGDAMTRQRLETQYQQTRNAADHVDRLCTRERCWSRSRTQAMDACMAAEDGIHDFRRDIHALAKMIRDGFAVHQNATKQQPWADDAPEFLPLLVACKLTDGRLSLSTLSKLVARDDKIRYMRKGQRRRVHVADLWRYMQSRQNDPKWAKAYLDFREAVGKGDRRWFWRCKACGHEWPENAAAPERCPKCKGKADIVPKAPPKPRR